MSDQTWTPEPGCWCARCDEAWNRDKPLVERWSRMNLCPQCGNKRCPRATWHLNDCTGSNEAGQPGSNHPRVVR